MLELLRDIIGEYCTKKILKLNVGEGRVFIVKWGLIRVNDETV
jgi:hypothetical protein